MGRERPDRRDVRAGVAEEGSLSQRARRICPPWLLGIARNVLRETVRLDRVETRARERLGLPVDLAAEEGAKVEERLSPRLALAAALDDLPEHEREALELRVVGARGFGGPCLTLRAVAAKAAKVRLDTKALTVETAWFVLPHGQCDTRGVGNVTEDRDSGAFDYSCER